jgi:hypothetical protein
MPTFPVVITQSYKVIRRITVTVEAADLASAVEQQSTDDCPDFHDPRWCTGWDLQDERVEPAVE